MSYVQQLRAKIDQSIDRWEAAAQSIEDYLVATGETVSEAVEREKAKARDAADRIKQGVERAQQLPPDVRNRIQRNLDHLKVQLTLGRAEALDAIDDQKRRIAEASRNVEKQIDAMDRQAREDINEAIEEWIRADIALQQELDQLSMELGHNRAEVRAALEAKKKKLLDQIKDFRTNLNDKRIKAEAKGEAFAAEMNQAFRQIKSAFSGLTS